MVAGASREQVVERLPKSLCLYRVPSVEGERKGEKKRKEGGRKKKMESGGGAGKSRTRRRLVAKWSLAPPENKL